ncbi:MAG: LysM peptidoglycan-binding domain-containing protein [Anaerolineae bacterium]
MAKSLILFVVVFIFILPVLAQQNDTYYTVVSGDTLYRISVRFKVPMSAIIQANAISNPQILFVGQSLRIPGTTIVPPTQQFASPNQSLSATRDANAATTVLRYTVARGDTLASIARRFNTSVSTLATANSITNINRINVGQVLRIVVTGTSAPTSVPPQSPSTQANITGFSVESSGIDRTSLYDKTLRIPVSWTVASRPDGTNLVFEQIFENGTKVNVELPRTNPYVASSGRGVIAPVYPPDNPNAERITIRLSLIRLSDGTYITFNSVTLPLNGAVPPQTGTTCRATINVATPLYSGPGIGYLVVSQVAGGDRYIVRARSSGWYELEYPLDNSQSGSGAWVDGARVTLSGECDQLVDRVYASPTIQSFTSGSTSVEWTALGTERARIPVTWNVANRPPRTNLIFEQLQSDGNGVNIELPRTERIIPSTGSGVVQAIYPADNPNVTSITIRLRLVNLDDNATLTQQSISIDLTGPTPTPPDQQAFQQEIPAAQCYDNDLLADSGVAVGKSGQGSTNLPPEGTDILSAPIGGVSLGRLNALDKFTILEGPFCWRWTYASNWSQLYFRMWKLSVPALNVEGWVSEFYYYGGQRTVYLQMDN